MELVVAMTLMAMLIGLAAPYVGNVLGVQVKSKARQLAGTMRYVFDEAIIQSSNYRIVFNLDKHSYTVEQCPGPSAVLYQNAEARLNAEEAQAEKQRRLESSSRGSADTVPLADASLQSCKATTDPQLESVVFEEPVTLLGVWTAQYPSVVRGNPNGPSEDAGDDQIAVVNFIKGGYAERAYVYLSDGAEDGDIYTLELEPLTGQVILHEGEVEVPREYWR